MMDKNVVTLENITYLVKPLAEKYQVKEIYLFGSYARGEADESSDMDFLVIGGEGFKLTQIFALGEELRATFNKKVDVFEINEINQDSEFYKTVMREKVLIA
ncbi:MAG: nucleotidyltransferase domain-containing protein [Anaerovibrio sp.]|nr:nucleotidyltransferase domain-containing protein [Anaerovibrio sp.]